MKDVIFITILCPFQNLNEVNGSTNATLGGTAQEPTEPHKGSVPAGMVYIVSHGQLTAETNSLQIPGPYTHEGIGSCSLTVPCVSAAGLALSHERNQVPSI